MPYMVDGNRAINGTLDEKYDNLQRVVRDLGSVAVAFSAGVDSTMLLRVCVDVLGPQRAVAVIGTSDSLPSGDLIRARHLAAECGVELIELDTDEFDDPNYVSNPVNRCYFCKAALYDRMRSLLEQRGLRRIVSGTNADDLSDYRPGISAASERDVCAPLAEAGLTKDDVRAISRRLGLPTHDQPASPCLSSRIPYGQPVTPEKLRMIDRAEAFLRAEFGIRECRVRHHGDIARIELPQSQLPELASPVVAEKIDEHFRSLGFRYVTVDLRGFRSGGLNDAIPLHVDVGSPKR